MIRVIPPYAIFSTLTASLPRRQRVIPGAWSYVKRLLTAWTRRYGLGYQHGKLSLESQTSFSPFYSKKGFGTPSAYNLGVDDWKRIYHQ